MRRGTDHGRHIVAVHGDIKIISFREDGGYSATDAEAAIRHIRGSLPDRMAALDEHTTEDTPAKRLLTQ